MHNNYAMQMDAYYQYNSGELLSVQLSFLASAFIIQQGNPKRYKHIFYWDILHLNSPLPPFAFIFEYRTIGSLISMPIRE